MKIRQIIETLDQLLEVPLDPEYHEPLKRHAELVTQVNPETGTSPSERHGANSPHQYAKHLGLDPQDLKAKYSTEKQSAQQIIDYCSDPQNDPIQGLIYIMAWGGSMRNVGHTASWINDSEKTDRIRDALVKLRDTSMAPQAAYQMMVNLRKDGILKGIGPAFFTKILFFFTAHKPIEQQCYILDQFLGKEMNLLNNFDKNYPLIRLGPDGMVPDSTTAQEYGDYCRGVHLLAQDMSALLGKTIEPKYAEFLIFNGLRDAAEEFFNTNELPRPPRGPRTKTRVAPSQPKPQANTELIPLLRQPDSSLGSLLGRIPKEHRAEAEQEALDDINLGKSEQEVLKSLSGWLTMESLELSRIRHLARHLNQ
jgi:hypothetical protein